MGKAQSTADGYTINYHRARMSGTVDLEELDIPHFVQGDVIVGVFVAKVEGFNSKEDKQGNITRTNVARCTDVRVLTGALKEVMVKQLGLAGTDTLELPMVSHAPVQAPTVTLLSDPVEVFADELPEDPEEAPEQDVFTPAPRAVEMEPAEDEDEDDDVWVPTQVEQVGRIGRQDTYSFPESERGNSNGPRTLPFVDRDAVQGVAEREVIGRVGSKDKVLRRALETEGWS